MINYILQVILFQILFLAVYDFFLRKETFFATNRWYLLGTAIASFVIPIIKIPSLQKVVPQEFVFSMPELIMSPEKVIENTNWFASLNTIQIVFLVGVVLFFVLFLIKLTKVFQLIYKNENIQKKQFTLVLLAQKTSAFSFFKYIFLGKDIPKEKQEKIIEHELVHSRQKHSLDLLFFEFLRIAMWFNPMIYIYQQRITVLHEYISDAIVSKSTTKEQYINNLLSDVFQVENISFVNQFYKQSLIKKRIIMMTKEKSNQLKLVKYLLLIPVLASMLLYVSCSENEIEPVQEKTVTKVYIEGKEVSLSDSKDRESYFDLYLGTRFPEGKEINFESLSNGEKLEVEKFTSKSGKVFYKELKIFQMPNNRKAIGLTIDFKNPMNSKTTRVSNISYTEDNIEREKAVSFMIIDKIPVFPGCKGTKAELKKCFSKSVQKHFLDNFNSKLPNEVGLASGKKRVFIGFKIDKEGNVVKIQVRAPHPDIKEEVIRVMKSLPKMLPGEIANGKKVAVKYNIPFTLLID